MSNIIKNFNSYKNINESVNLTEKEKEFLWKKMEFNKRKKAEKSESDLYKMLKGDKEVGNKENLKKLLNALEYSIKKRVKMGNAPKGKYEDAFKSIQNKIPEDWFGVKYSSLKAKEKREEKKPTEASTKKEIKKWLDKEGIKYENSETKKELLKKIK